MKHKEKKVDCVIVNYNDSETTLNLVRFIYDYENINKIIIVDNNSTDNSYDELLKIKKEKIDILRSKTNKGYGAGNNLGINYSKKNYNTKYVLISNPDVVFKESFLDKLLLEIQKEKAAVASGKQINNNNISSIVGWDIPSSKEYILKSFFTLGKIHKNKYLKYSSNKEYITFPDCVPGALLLVDSDKFIEVGGYDEQMFLYSEETLLGYKLKQKNYITLLLDENYYHNHSTTISKFFNKKKTVKEINKSRKHIVKNYFNKGKKFNFIFDILFFIALIENYIILFIMSLFRKER